MLLLDHVPIKLQTLIKYAYEIEIQHSLVRCNPTGQLQTIGVVVLSPSIYRPFITITYSSPTACDQLALLLHNLDDCTNPQKGLGFFN